MRFVVPVALCLIAGLFMCACISIPKAVLATIFSCIAFLFYHAYIGELFDDVYGVAIGLLINYIISILGIILPIVTVVLKKVEEKKRHSLDNKEKGFPECGRAFFLCFDKTNKLTKSL